MNSKNWLDFGGKVKTVEQSRPLKFGWVLAGCGGKIYGFVEKMSFEPVMKQ